MFNSLKEEYDKKYNEELNKTGIFWAFNNEQFEENKTHKNVPDNEYLSIGAGGYIHKSNKFKLDYFLNVTLPKMKREFTSKIDMKDLIEYELDNHECYYTSNISEAVDAVYDFYELPKNEIEDKVAEVYKEKLNRFDLKNRKGHTIDNEQITKSIYNIDKDIINNDIDDFQDGNISI